MWLPRGWRDRTFQSALQVTSGSSSWCSGACLASSSPPPHLPRRSVVFGPGEGEATTSPPSGPACDCGSGGVPALEVAPRLALLPTLSALPQQQLRPLRGGHPAAGAAVQPGGARRGGAGPRLPCCCCCCWRAGSGDSGRLPRRDPRPGAQRPRGRAGRRGGGGWWCHPPGGEIGGRGEAPDRARDSAGAWERSWLLALLPGAETAQDILPRASSAHPSVMPRQRGSSNASLLTPSWEIEISPIFKRSSEPVRHGSPSAAGVSQGPVKCGNTRISTYFFDCQVQFLCKEISDVSATMLSCFEIIWILKLNSVAFGKKICNWSLRQRNDKLKDKVRV